MYSMSNLVFALIIGGGIGGVAGWYLALNARGDNKRKVIMDLESQLDQAKHDRADYEAEVSEHFSQTADLLHKLTDDYRAVYSHLADGAEQLCGDRVSISEAALTARRRTRLTNRIWLGLRNHWTTRQRNRMSRGNSRRRSGSISPTAPLPDPVRPGYRYR